MRVVAPVLLMVFAVAGCDGASTAPPVSSVRTLAPGPSNSEPQSRNSLPPGSAVSSPFTPAAGDVGTTRVSPVRGR